LDAKLEEIRLFMEVPVLRVMSIQHDADLKQPLMRALIGMQDDEDFPHVLSYSDRPFHGYEQYSGELLHELVEANDKLRTEFAELNVDLPSPPADLPQDERTPESAVRRVAEYQSAVAESLPAEVGSVVLILDPSGVDDEDQFAWTVFALALATVSDRAKYILLDRRQNPMLPDPESRSELAFCVQFHLAPEEIEAQLQREIAGGSLSPAETRTSLLLAGAFAASAGRKEEAEMSQAEALRLTQEDGSSVEQANILYNLGNTYLEQRRLPDAEDAYLRSANLCMEHQVNPLLALVLTNLGVTLHRQGRVDESLEALDAARQTFRALSHPPGEAHALDTKARILALEHRTDEAETAWLEALEVYEDISAPHLQDVRQGGSMDIRARLEQFYADTGQKEKLSRMAEGKG